MGFNHQQKQILVSVHFNKYFLFIFQVFAVNAEGTSEPLECVDAFIPENPFGTPGAPGKPEQIGGDFDNFEVKYEEPRNNGGSKVTSYELQARLWRANDWFDCGSDKLCMNRLEARGQFEGLLQDECT